MAGLGSAASVGRSASSSSRPRCSAVPIVVLARGERRPVRRIAAIAVPPVLLERCTPTVGPEADGSTYCAGEIAEFQTVWGRSLWM